MPAFDDDEAPVEPAPPQDPRLTADLQRKLRRLVVISSLTFGVGFLALVFAIIWRVVNPREERVDPPEAGVSVVAELPAGATILGSTLDGDRIAILIEVGGATRLMLYDLEGRSLGSVDFIAR